MSAASEGAEAVRIARTLAPATDDINRIIIGVGGQGSRIVNEVRKEVLRQGALPGGLEFMAVDSDRVALAGLDSVPEDHRLYLAAPDDNITETVVPWLPHEFRPKAGGGCGMQRLTGKAMYLVHRHRILGMVREVARKLRQRTHASNFMVVFVNAFGGGTGSGMMIDFAIDLRADLKELTGQDPLMFGVGILPSRSETIQRANGVALIKELHLLLSNKEPIVIGGRDYSNPFELYFLVGREIMGIERDDDVLRSIVRFTIDLGLIPSSSRDTAGSGKGAGYVDLQDIRTLVKGAGHMFSTFGYYRAVFPADTLHDYFEARDRLDALRKELPAFSTDIEGKRRLLEDRKIAVAHAESLVREGRARAAKLRTTGILGANRPDLAKLLGDLARAEDALAKARREVAETEADLPHLAERREAVEAEMRDCETRAETLRRSLLQPVQSRSHFTIPLLAEEIDHLDKNRHLLEEGGFRAVMEELGRLPEYHEKTMEVIGKNKILYLPLLNYRMAFHTAAMFPPRVLAALAKSGFVRFDGAGNPVVANDRLWMVMAMMSSRPENVDADKVAARAFKEVVEGHIARRAEVKTAVSASKRWEVVIHSWMVGLQIAPVAPGYPPRLRELEWLLPEYEQVAREGQLAQHHAFLYGDPVAFTRLTSLPLDRTSIARTNAIVTDFWSGYAPIDAPARWQQLPPVLAETLVAAEDVAAGAGALADASRAFRASDGAVADLDRFASALETATEAASNFQRVFAEDAQPLRERVAATANMLEKSRVSPRDPEELLAMEELAAEAAAATSTAARLLAESRTDLPAPSLAPAEGESARDAVRREHLVAQAHGRAARLSAAFDAALASLGDLDRLLATVRQTLRTRSLEPLPPGVAAAAAPVAVEGPANPHGNGHHVERLEERA